jgi:hypothetical protein
MCFGVAVPWDDLPTHLLAQPAVRRRRYRRGHARPEARFLFSDPDRRLPVLIHGELRLLPWGARRGETRRLPCTGWTWKETLEKGMWRELAPEPVIVPACFVLDHGVWFHAIRGVQALAVRDANGEEVAYVLVEPASHYYQVMTRSRWMPVLLGQTI